MSTVPQTAAKGQTLFRTTMRVIDDGTDRFIASAYQHNVNEWSGTHAAEITSRMMFLEAVVDWASLLDVINKTGSDIDAFKLVRVSGYDITSGKLTIELADKDTGAAQFVTTATIADDDEGYIFRNALGTSLDTSAFSAEGDEVFLGDDGDFAISGAQSVGRVAAVDASDGQIIFLISESPSTSSVKVISTKGAKIERTFIEEEITLANAASTDSTANLLPAGAVILAVTGRVTLGLANPFSVGDAGDSTRFASAVAGALNTTFNSLDSATPTAPLAWGSTANKIRLTHNAADNGKKVRVTVFYEIVTPPTS